MASKVRVSFRSLFLVTAILLAAALAMLGAGAAKGANGPALFAFGLLGSGALSTSCNGQTGICTSNLNARINGNAIGNRSTFSDSMTWSVDAAIRGGGQICYPAAGIGMIVTIRRDQINFSFSGILCGNSDSFVPSVFNGTYNVTGGTGRFANSLGSGNFTQNNIIVRGSTRIHPAPGATVTSGPAAIVRFDGTLTPKQSTAIPTRTATFTATATATATGTAAPTVTQTATATTTATSTATSTVTPTATPTPGEATIFVNTLKDENTPHDGLCSLREAINNANSSGSDTTGGDCVTGLPTDLILFSVSGTITLTSSLPAINSSVVIDDSATFEKSPVVSVGITVDGASAFRVMTVNQNASLSLIQLTIANGKVAGNGAGIINSGTLVVGLCTFSNNSATGGGVGGGIYSNGTLGIVESTFIGNSASGDGGGIYSHGAALTIVDSTFTSNTAHSGGGVYNDATAMAAVNDTFAGNTAIAAGGGAILSAVEVDVFNDTFAGNTGGAVNAPTLKSANSIFGAGTGNNCSGTVTDDGYNISTDHSCGFTGTGANGKQIGDNVDPLLAVNGLQNNGGPTETIALQASSPAIDAIPQARCITTDQRGVTRPDNGENACDVGAYEFVDVAIRANPRLGVRRSVHR